MVTNLWLSAYANNFVSSEGEPWYAAP